MAGSSTAEASIAYSIDPRNPHLSRQSLVVPQHSMIELETPRRKVPMELEQAPAAVDSLMITPEWKKRKGWFQNTRTHREARQHELELEQAGVAAASTQQIQPPFSAMAVSSLEANGNDSLMYYRMDADSIPTQQKPGEQKPGEQKPAEQVAKGAASTASFAYPPSEDATAVPRNPSPAAFRRVSSWMTQSSVVTLNNFDESEWTPTDSSYGAAIPIMGWIPKNIRRMIEHTLIAFSVMALVYLVVTTSISLTDGNHHHSPTSNNNGALYLDDDRYIEIYYDETGRQYNEEFYNLTDDDGYYRHLQQQDEPPLVEEQNARYKTYLDDDDHDDEDEMRYDQYDTRQSGFLRNPNTYEQNDDEVRLYHYYDQVEDEATQTTIR